MLPRPTPTTVASSRSPMRPPTVYRSNLKSVPGPPDVGQPPFRKPEVRVSWRLLLVVVLVLLLLIIEAILGDVSLRFVACHAFRTRPNPPILALLMLFLWTNVPPARPFARQFQTPAVWSCHVGADGLLGTQ